MSNCPYAVQRHRASCAVRADPHGREAVRTLARCVPSSSAARAPLKLPGARHIRSFLACGGFGGSTKSQEDISMEMLASTEVLSNDKEGTEGDQKSQGYAPFTGGCS